MNLLYARLILEAFSVPFYVLRCAGTLLLVVVRVKAMLGALLEAKCDLATSCTDVGNVVKFAR